LKTAEKEVKERGAHLGDERLQKQGVYKIQAKMTATLPRGLVSKRGAAQTTRGKEGKIELSLLHVPQKSKGTNGRPKMSQYLV